MPGDGRATKWSTNPAWWYPWRPCDHPTPGTRHTGQPVESSKEHTYQGKRGVGEAAATDLQSSVRTAKQALQALQARGRQAGPASVWGTPHDRPLASTSRG